MAGSLQVPLNLLYELGIQGFLCVLNFAAGGKLVHCTEVCAVWAVALLADAVFSRVLRRAPFRVLSTVAAANTLCLFFAGNAAAMALSAATMIAVKHLVRRADGRHLFNSGAIGVLVCGAAQVLLANGGGISSVSCHGDCVDPLLERLRRRPTQRVFQLMPERVRW